MKYTLLFSTLAAGLVLTGCNRSTRTSTAATDTSDNAAVATTPAPAPSASDSMANAANSASNAFNSAANTVSNQAHVAEWKLSGNDLQADLDAKRDIIRTRDNAPTPTGNVDKSMVKSSIESKLNADRDTSALKLDVNVKRDGEVELEGKANSADEVGKAIACALDTDGVTKVTSKIRLSRDARMH